MIGITALKRACIAAWNRLLMRLTLTDPYGNTASYEDMSSTLNAMPDLMFELDEQGRHWDFRALRPELLVAPAEALLGHTVSEVMPPEASKTVMAALQETIENGYSHGTIIHLPTPIGKRWFEVSMARKEKRKGESSRFIVLSRDISDRMHKQIEAERLAYIDTLTELPNRHRLQERLEEAFENSKTSGQYGALLFLDLDNFKILNDSKGHYVGDQLLQLVAQRLRANVRKGDLVARWGGDEFVVMIQHLGAVRDDATQLTTLVCDQIIAHLNSPYELDGTIHQCYASIGVNLFNGSERSIEQIIDQADHAMYAAKESSAGQYQFYS